MLIPVLLFIVGLVLLIKGGDWFVDGATDIARRFHIPEIIVGATVVSIGTTLPEVMVSSIGAYNGQSAMAYGNAIGSIICNTALISAITITAKPGPVNAKALKMPVIFFFVSAIFFSVVAYTSGDFTRPMGLILLAIFFIYMFLTVRDGFKNPQPQVEEEAQKDEDSLGKALVLLIGGAAVIAVGAKLLVDNGTIIARTLGVPETVIALTFVALGTSLPELVTAITSLMKGHGSLSLGNVIGANIFNLVLVSGISITIAPFHLPEAAQLFGHNASLVLDVPVMLGVMAIMTLPALFRKKLSRFQGILLLCIYAAFCAIQFTM